MSKERISISGLLEHHEEDRKKITWGSYGFRGNEELKRIPIKDLKDDHIFNILTTQPLSFMMRHHFITEMYWRLSGRKDAYEVKHE